MEKSANKNIVWLASYPKSGNTWFRAFLSVLLKEGPLDINRMETDQIFSDKVTIETVLDISTDYLSAREVETFQRETYTYLSAESRKTLYVKIHDAFTLSQTDNLPRIPEASVKQAIYLVRNPLDVALSLANHTGLSVEKVIQKFIVNPEGAFISLRNSSYSQLYQPLGTWSMHAESWLTRPGFPVHFVRYEDMKTRPLETFTKAIVALGIPASKERIGRAIEECKFENLQKKEAEHGFREKGVVNSLFFFKGEVGRWKEELTSGQVKQIREANEPMMRHFGYW